MCEKKCKKTNCGDECCGETINYVSCGDNENCCNGTITTYPKYKDGETYIVGDYYCFYPHSEIKNCFGERVDIFLNDKKISFLTKFKYGSYGVILDSYLVEEDLEKEPSEEGGVLKIITAFGEKEVVLFNEKVSLDEKEVYFDVKENLIKVKKYFFTTD